MKKKDINEILDELMERYKNAFKDYDKNNKDTQTKFDGPFTKQDENNSTNIAGI